MQNGNMMHAADMLCSISFDRDDEYFATAGVSRRIKVYTMHSCSCGGILVLCLTDCVTLSLVRLRSSKCSMQLPPNSPLPQRIASAGIRFPAMRWCQCMPVYACGLEGSPRKSSGIELLL